MSGEYSSLPLGGLGVLRARGADAVSFLQGQVSNDVSRLAPHRSLLAGYHNPQGRVIALMRLLQLAPDDVLAIVPRELIGRLLERLGKFILRAKVKLTDDSQAWTISGLILTGTGPQTAPFAAALPAGVNQAASLGEWIAVRIAQQPPRWLCVGPAAQAWAPAHCTTVAAVVWQRLAIGSGEPQVYASTCEAFVAQMLNLDVLGAIAFDKGCYTGQEVIARAHYRGRVKRRLQRFRSAEPAQLKAGDTGVLADGRSFTVVEAAALEDGGCEFLAVAPVVSDGSAASGDAISARQLQLPYPLPA